MEGRAGGTNSQRFGVGGGIFKFTRTIAGARDDFAFMGDDSAHWNFAARGSGFGFREGFVHETGELGHGPVVAAFHGAVKLVARGMVDGERIAKRLSRAGVASRREAERMIEAGRVSVNGDVIESPALNVTDADVILVDEAPIPTIERPRVWMYHKPTGLVTSNSDEKGRDTVFDKLPDTLPRVMAVGRLDMNSEGLLLLTNDGGVKRKLELPSTGWLRKYRVRMKGNPKDEDFAPLRRGIVAEGERFQPMDVSLDRVQGSNAWITIGLREGKNREIRRAMAELGFEVNRLIRVSYGPFRLGELKQGEVEEIKSRVLRDQLGLEAATEGHAEPKAKVPFKGKRKKAPPKGAAPGGAHRVGSRPEGGKPAERAPAKRGGGSSKTDRQSRPRRGG